MAQLIEVLKRKPFVTVTITLTNADTLYNIYALMVAACPTIAIPQACSTLLIESDSANAAGAKIFIGDDQMTLTARRGYTLVTGASRNYQTLNQIIPLSQLHARTASAGAQLNIEVMVP